MSTDPGMSQTSLPGASTTGFIMGNLSDDDQLAERERERQAVWAGALRTHSEYLAARGRQIENRLGVLARVEGTPTPDLVRGRLVLESERDNLADRVQQVDVEVARGTSALGKAASVVAGVVRRDRS